MERWRRALVALTALHVAAAGPRYSSRIVHTHAGAIRGIIVEPASRRLEPVEVFLGVPYAGQPPRLGPPPPAPRWPGTRLADAHPPVCPQAVLDISNRTAALSKMPLGVYNELKTILPLLANQSEDCLHLNIYVPGSGARGVEAPYAVVVWLAGAVDAEGAGAGGAGGAAATLDGSVLAARAHLLVVTVSYRVGLLGYLTSGDVHDAARAAGGAAVLDVAAALAWTRVNVAAFGGDPRRVTLVAHGAAAALAGAALILPETKGLVSRVVLLSGSPLSAGAVSPEPERARRAAADALRCLPEPGLEGDWLIDCVRRRPLGALLAVQPPRARFLAGWAPAVPGAGAGGSGDAERALHGGALLDAALMVVVATTESYHYFSEDDIRHGFEEEHRNRILRTYVRNVYRWHRNEIFAAVRNEYTDWEKPIQHPVNLRDATLDALSDAAGAAPAARLLALHARRGLPAYATHFAHQSRDAAYPQRLGSVSSETLAYFLGLPLVGGAGGAGGLGGAGARNYSRADAGVADAAVALLASFAKSGEPSAHHVACPRYELNTQQYLSIGTKLRVRSHYRGHKMALWLHLVPQLHRPGAAAAHHQFRLALPDMYAGDIFPEQLTTAAALEDSSEPDEGEAEDAEPPGADECSPSPARPALAAPAPSAPRGDSLTTLDNQYYSYTVALGVTVGAGCFLLALNVLVFAGIYLQRGRRRQRRPRRDGSCSRAGSSSSSAVVSSPRKSTLKRSSESELKERPVSAAPPVKKRVQIQEISV